MLRLFSRINTYEAAAMKEPHEMTDAEIISQMENLNATRPQTRNGRWGASLRYKALNEALNKRSIHDGRPPEEYSPPLREEKGS